MSKVTTFERDILELIFNNTALANIGDGSGLQPAATEGSLYISLYSSNPDEDASGTEVSYTGYARVAVARNSSNWLVNSDGSVENVGAITFGECTAGSVTATHFGIHTAVSAGDLLYYGVLADSILIDTGPNVVPEIAAGALLIVED